MPPESPERPAEVFLIGRKEYLDFPEWELRRVKVKVDTGARTSALDAAGYDLCETDAGLLARLRLRLSRRRPDHLTVVETPVLRMTVVSNSSGMREQRPVVEALVRLGPVRKRILLTVTNRAGMRFPMILGREALAGTFLVDVSQTYLLRP